MAETKKPSEKPFLMPEGRVIYHNLFVRSAYKDDKGVEGKPTYKVEMAYDVAQVQGTDTTENAIENIILEFLDRTVGGTAGDDYLNGKIHGPFVNGDELAWEREKKQKDGSAYKGKLILRPTNMFNAQGNDAEGGSPCFGPDMSDIGLLMNNTDQIYNGCYGIVKVKLFTYLVPMTKQLAISTRLVAFQKTRDGDKLGGGNHSSLFEPVGGAATPAAGRRSRAG